LTGGYEQGVKSAVGLTERGERMEYTGLRRLGTLFRRSRGGSAGRFSQNQKGEGDGRSIQKRPKFCPAPGVAEKGPEVHSDSKLGQKRRDPQRNGGPSSRIYGKYEALPRTREKWVAQFETRKRGEKGK